jgi:preprotein translocase subunit SecG
MVQNSKGGGLSSSFGNSQSLGGVQKTNDFLEKSTWTLAGLLIVLILLSSLSFTGTLSDNNSKILDDSAPVKPAITTPAPAKPAATNSTNTTTTTKPVAEPVKK